MMIPSRRWHLFGPGQCPGFETMGWSDLHSAAGDNDTVSISALISSKSNVNEKDGVGLTPLHVAAGQGSAEAVKLLCSLCADVNATSGFESATALFMAVTEGHNDCLEALLDSEADINLQSKDGSTVLYEACRNGLDSTVELLLSRKAEVSIAANDGTTCLHVAVEYKANTVVAKLRAAGADIYADDRDFRTPCSLAQDDAMKRALGSWKPELIMSMMELFCEKVRERIRKETAMPLDSAEKALSSPRFLLLFCLPEFAAFIERMKARRKDLAAVRRTDVDDEGWRVRCFGAYYNCVSVFAEPLAASPTYRAYVRGCFARHAPAPHDDDDAPDPGPAPVGKSRG